LGLGDAHRRALPRYRESERVTPLEKLVLDHAGG
jgi:hypothetical protein